jgi:hypothetical protein
LPIIRGKLGFFNPAFVCGKPVLCFSNKKASPPTPFRGKD